MPLSVVTSLRDDSLSPAVWVNSFSFADPWTGCISAPWEKDQFLLRIPFIIKIGDLGAVKDVDSCFTAPTDHPSLFRYCMLCSLQAPARDTDATAI